MILKTYLRLFTTDVDKSLSLAQRLTGRAADFRAQMPEIGLDLAGIGDILIIGGNAEHVDPFRDSVGPFVVDDLEETQAILVEEGGTVTSPIQDVPTGRRLYVRHADGNQVEYVQWNQALAEQILGRPTA